VDRGLEPDGEFVEPGCHGPVSLESIDPALDRVAGFVVIAVEGWRTPTSTAMPLTVAGLVGSLGDRGADAAPAQVGAVGS